MNFLSNAKINLGLKITGKRPDGFHNIESILVPISLQDDVRIQKADQQRFSSTGFFIPGDPQENLCVKAYHLLKKDFEIPAVYIHLHKNIPVGSGLGGGSSNAVATLKALNQLFKLNITESQFLDYAQKLGSDCAFFVQNKTALVSGRGEIIEEYPLDLKGLELLLVYPGLFISTADAFSKVIPSKEGFSLSEISNLSRNEWQERVENDFEKTIFKEHPEIGRIKNKLIESDAIYSSMSGSGSAVYGFFENGKLPKLELPSNYFVWEGKVLS